MLLGDENFFLEGAAEDQAYINIRDIEHLAPDKACIERLWQLYRPYADPHFREDARNHFHQRFWEMYLAVTLLERGIKLEKHGRDGPEFSTLINGKRTWFEAIAPTSGTGENQVEDLQHGRVTAVPVEKILLRFTSAFFDKKKRYLQDFKKSLIAPEDSYILAINSRGIPHAAYGDTMPYFLQAFLGIGPLAVTFNTKTLEQTGAFYDHRPIILKKNGEPIAATEFLQESSSFCSTIIHSSVDCVNYPPVLGNEFQVLHNPMATHPIGMDVFNWCTQYVVDGDRLQKIEASLN